MRYNPPNKEDEIETQEQEETDPVYWEGRPRYISDQTMFMRWSTEMEQKNNIIDNEFMKQHKYLIMDMDKILALSFIDNPKSLKLFRLRRQLAVLCKDANLEELAAETILSNLADYQTTRGIRGNFQNALITQKREWYDKTAPEKKGLFSKMIRAKSDEQKAQDMLEVY